MRVGRIQVNIRIDRLVVNMYITKRYAPSKASQPKQCNKATMQQWKGIHDLAVHTCRLDGDWIKHKGQNPPLMFARRYFIKIFGWFGR